MCDGSERTLGSRRRVALAGTKDASVYSRVPRLLGDRRCPGTPMQVEEAQERFLSGGGGSSTGGASLKDFLPVGTIIIASIAFTVLLSYSFI